MIPCRDRLVSILLEGKITHQSDPNHDFQGVMWAGGLTLASDASFRAVPLNSTHSPTVGQISRNPVIFEVYEGEQIADRLAKEATGNDSNPRGPTIYSQ